MFRGLSRAQLTKLNDLPHRKVFAAGTVFINVEQPGEVIYFIVRGAVKVFIDDAEGAEVILAILAAGEVIGEMSLVDASARCANAVALEETTAFWMDRASFRECPRTMPAIHDNLLRLMCNRLRQANARIQSLALRDVEGRIAHQLLAFAEIHGRRSADGAVAIPFRLTQSDLASLVRATRPRVNQVIAAYKQRRYISVDQNCRITIHNWEALDRRGRRDCEPPAARETARGYGDGVSPILQR